MCVIHDASKCVCTEMVADLTHQAGAVSNSSDVDRALDRAGITWFSFRVCMICGFGWLADGVEGQVLSFMLPTLEERWNLTATELASLAACVSVGQALGAVIWGAVADSYGRRKAYLGSLLVASLFGTCSAFAPHFASYLVLRAATGFGIGGNLPVSIALVAEFLGPNVRATTIVLMHLFYEVGELVTIGLAWFLLSSKWRIFLLATAAPAAVMVIVSIRYLPESPQWLLSKGEAKKARDILLRTVQSPPLRPSVPCQRKGHHDEEDDESSDDGYDSPDVFLPTSANHNASLATTAHSDGETPTTTGLRTLFARKLAPTTLAMMCLWFFAQLGSGWSVWVPEIAQLRHLSKGSTYVSLAVARVVAMTAFLFAAKMIEGRPFKLLTAALMLTMGASAVFAIIVGQSDLTSAWTFGAGYVIFVFFFALTWPVMYATTPMSFPTYARGVGFGVANSASKCGSMLHPLIAGIFIHHSIGMLGAVWTGGWMLAVLSSITLSRLPIYL